MKEKRLPNWKIDIEIRFPETGGPVVKKVNDIKESKPEQSKDENRNKQTDPPLDGRR